MPRFALTATIPAGESLSSVVDVGDNFIVGLIMPSAWTIAHITVLVSIDNINFFDLYDLPPTDPSELKFNVIPNAIVAADSGSMLMARYIKLRSGESGKPIAQEQTRTITIITSNKAASA